MFKVQYDFSEVSKVFVTGVLDLPQAFSVSLLASLGKFEIHVKDLDDLDFLESTDIVMTNNAELVKDLESHKVKTIPLDLEPFVETIFGSGEFSTDLLNKVLPLLDSKESNAWMSHFRMHLVLDFVWVCQVITRLVWATLIAEYRVQDNLQNFVKDNPPEEIEKGFYLVPGIKDISMQDYYLNLQKEKVALLTKAQGKKMSYMVFRDVTGQWQASQVSVSKSKTTPNDLVFPKKTTIREIIRTIKKHKKENQ